MKRILLTLTTESARKTYETVFMNCRKLILYNITFKAMTTMYETTTMQHYEYEPSLEVQEESGELEEIKGETRIRKLKNKKSKKSKKSKKKQKNTKEKLRNKESV